jgi:hypothetical protein
MTLANDSGVLNMIQRTETRKSNATDNIPFKSPAVALHCGAFSAQQRV